MNRNLPPGVTDRMIDEAAGVWEPCTVCGKLPDDCICPECPTCQAVGDPSCYQQHGLIRSAEQLASHAEAMQAKAREAEIEAQEIDRMLALRAAEDDAT